MKFTILLLDVSNLFYKCYYLNNKDLKQTIIKFIKMSDYYKREYLNSGIGKIYYLFDNPESKHSIRREISEEYKKNRIKQPEEFYKALDFLKNILINRENFNKVCAINFCEGDDLVKPILENIDFKYNKVLVISEDLDWSRTLGFSDNIYWYSKKIIWDKKLFKEKYGFFPYAEKIILYKCIRGDKSDNIEIGIKGIKEDILLKILSEYDSIYTFLANYKKLDYINSKLKNTIFESESRLRKNYQLINFLEIKKEDLEENIIETNFNRSELLNLYFMLDIKLEDIEYGERLNNFYKFAQLKKEESKDFFQAGYYDIK